MLEPKPDMSSLRGSWVLGIVSIQRISGAENETEWLEKRKAYLTASSVYAWRGANYADPKNAWYFEENNRENVLAEKFEGFEKEFTSHAEVSMNHGRVDEKHIVDKVGKMLGCDVVPENSMFVNDKWAGIAATIDATIFRPEYYMEPYYCQTDSLVEKARGRLEQMLRGDSTVLEIKKSVSVAWARNIVPEYYIAQVQTQLHVVDREFGIIAAECIFPHPKEKWRKFWDLRPFVIERDENWANVLDQCNEEFLTEKEKYGLL